jgi:methylmalonyl-CoA/ethylmalonyl-CoA epimerase
MNRLHHIAIVVDSIDKSLDWYCKLYNAKPLLDTYQDKNQLVYAQFIETENIKIELLEPINENSPIKKFIDKHGSGSLYHLAFEVDDLDAVDKEVRQKGGMPVSRTKEAWNGMEVMFVMFFKNSDHQLVEYVKL